MVTFETLGSFKKTFSFLEKFKEGFHVGNLDKYGAEGVAALASATPIDTGLTAASWSYTIERGPGYASVVFSNSNTQKGQNIALLLQYGHGTRNGGYVVGRDYINPAIQPIFDRIAEEAWKEVTR